MIMATPPGQITGIVKTAEGYRILKIISKEPAGQRELSDPRVQQHIREQLRDRREQLLKTAYYEQIRNQAKVDNYYAAQVLQNDGKAD
jgi:peptidyl-prolyl cis-trans isomerase SurA